MKRLMIVVLAMVLIVGCGLKTKELGFQVIPSPTYTYDGEIDPAIFFTWDFYDYVNHGEYEIYWFTNPDTEAEILGVEMMSADFYGDGNMKLLGYRYFINGDEYHFILNVETNNYDMEIIYAHPTFKKI